MIVLAAIAVLSQSPALDKAQTCRAHLELLIEDVAREGGQVAGPTWFIRDWWDEQAEAAGAPVDDREAVAARKVELEREKGINPAGFQAGRGACIDAALDAGAVPGMARVRPG